MRTLFAVIVWIIPCIVAKGVSAELVKPVCVDGSAVCLYDDGSTVAWNIQSGSVNRQLSTAVRETKPLGIDADANIL